MPLLQPLLTPLLVSLWLALGCSTRSPDPGAATVVQEVTLGDRQFQLELAADDASRIQGLSDRPSLPPNGGMLFVFPDAAVRSFVMRRCLFDIDIVFLGPNGRIVATHEMKTEPMDTPEHRLRRYSSQWPAQFAIEVPAGTIDALGLREGQAVELPLDELKAMAD